MQTDGVTVNPKRMNDNLAKAIPCGQMERLRNQLEFFVR